MCKYDNGDNDDFSYNSRNIKNPVHNVNQNVTPSSAQKSNINTNKSVNDSNIQSNNNFVTPAYIFLTEIMPADLLIVPTFALTKIL